MSPRSLIFRPAASSPSLPVTLRSGIPSLLCPSRYLAPLSPPMAVPGWANWASSFSAWSRPAPWPCPPTGSSTPGSMRKTRARRRAIPRGGCSLAALSSAYLLLLCAGTAFIASTAGFWVLLSPIVFRCCSPCRSSAFVCHLSLDLKRFTQLCHYYLGAALALAPICAWIAITGSLAASPLYMAGRRPHVDRRVRHHLCLPGLSPSTCKAGTLFHPGQARHRPRTVEFPV